MDMLWVESPPADSAFPRPLAVMHVTETWTGGVGTYLESLLRQQLHDPSLHRVHLACSAARTPNPLAFEGHPKLRVHRYASSRNPLRVWGARAAIASLLHAERPDLIHLHSTFAGVYGRTIATGIPIVYCAHGWAFTQEVSWPKRLAYSAVEAALARRAHAIVHISHDEFRAAWRRGVRAPINSVILPSVRAPRVSEHASIAVDRAKINLGFIGRFDRQKGAEILLSALRQVDREDLHLYLLGDFDRDAAKFLAAAQSDRRVTRLGWIDHDRIDDYITRLDAVVIPSRWEGFGLVASESMRNGKAVLVSHRGGLPEQVIDGFNGLAFSIDDPRDLARLLMRIDKAELAVLGANAKRVWSASFGEQRMYQALCQLYRRVVFGEVVQAQRD